MQKVKYGTILETEKNKIDIGDSQFFIANCKSKRLFHFLVRPSTHQSFHLPAYLSIHPFVGP